MFVKKKQKKVGKREKREGKEHEPVGVLSMYHQHRIDTKCSYQKTLVKGSKSEVKAQKAKKDLGKGARVSGLPFFDN